MIGLRAHLIGRRLHERSPLRHHEQHVVLYEYRDGPAHRRTCQPVLLDQAHLGRERPVRLPVTTDDARLEDPSELPVRRHRAVVVDLVVWAELHGDDAKSRTTKPYLELRLYTYRYQCHKVTTQDEPARRCKRLTG